MNIGNIDNIFLILLFVVPGFLSIYIRDAVAGVRILTQFEKILFSIFFSFINLTIIVLILRTTIGYESSSIEIVKNRLFEPLFLLILLAISLVIGYLFAKGEQWLYSHFRAHFRLAALKPSETVFKTIFDRTKARWVEVKMKDGHKLADTVEYASHNKELYIVNVQKYNEQIGKWEHEEPLLDGVYLDLKEVEYLKVFEPEEIIKSDRHDEERKKE